MSIWFAFVLMWGAICILNIWSVSWAHPDGLTSAQAAAFAFTFQLLSGVLLRQERA